jgi:hypothetical protein
MYGVDICLAARRLGLQSYAIPAFCIHNTTQLLSLPKEFYLGYQHVKQKWRQYLPIYTSCIKITRFDRDMRERKLRHVVDKLLKRTKTPTARISDPRTLVPGMSAQGRDYR